MWSVSISCVLTHSPGKNYKTGVYRAMLYIFVKLIFNYMLISFTAIDWLERGLVGTRRCGTSKTWRFLRGKPSSEIRLPQTWAKFQWISGKYLKWELFWSSSRWGGQWKSFILISLLSQNKKSFALFWGLFTSLLLRQYFSYPRLSLSSWWSWISHHWPSSPKCWDYRQAPPDPVHMVVRVEPWTLLCWAKTPLPKFYPLSSVLASRNSACGCCTFLRHTRAPSWFLHRLTVANCTS